MSSDNTNPNTSSPVVPWYASLSQYVPKWLSNRNGANVGFRFLFSMVQPLDKAMQAIIEGIRAKYPGLGTPTAIPLLAQSRGKIQGEAETVAHFVPRLLSWLDDWTQNDVYPLQQMAVEIQNYLGNTPRVTVVDRAGHWLVLDPDGTVTETTAPWNWDGNSNPERAGAGGWNDVWIIVYPCEWAQAPTITARAAFSHLDGFGCGTLVQRVAFDAISLIVTSWKGAHSVVRAIVWSYDSTFCVPNGSNNPDGWYGASSKISGGPAGVRILARTANARYSCPTSL